MWVHFAQSRRRRSRAWSGVAARTRHLSTNRHSPPCSFPLKDHTHVVSPYPGSRTVNTNVQSTLAARLITLPAGGRKLRSVACTSSSFGFIDFAHLSSQPATKPNLFACDVLMDKERQVNSQPSTLDLWLTSAVQQDTQPEGVVYPSNRSEDLVRFANEISSLKSL